MPHQANKRIIEATAERMKLPLRAGDGDDPEIRQHHRGTIPLCLWDYEKKLKAGDRLLLAAFGGGFTWGGVYMTWAYNLPRKPARFDGRAQPVGPENETPKSAIVAFQE